MKRYRDLNGYLREIFGERVQKISLDAGFSCPNRDGSLPGAGCIYCDSRGSGTGAMLERGISLDEQINSGMEFAGKRYNAQKFIAYFQSFTNTYAPVDYLKGLYDNALSHSGMVGLSIGTRPDCINRETLELLCTYQKKYMVWLELGLQSSHDTTLQKINRGHDVACFIRAVKMINSYGLDICVHVILGLPGENRDMMLETARFLSEMEINGTKLKIKGVKIHLMYVVMDTVLADLYKKGEFSCLEREEYVDLVIDFLELLPPDMVIQRLTGDPPFKELVAPDWALEKRDNLNHIKKRIEERDTWQGKKWKQSIAGK